LLETVKVYEDEGKGFEPHYDNHDESVQYQEGRYTPPRTIENGVGNWERGSYQI
jgi:hypothetical protein